MDVEGILEPLGPRHEEVHTMVRKGFLSAALAAAFVFGPATDAWSQATAPRDMPSTHAIRAGLLIDPVEGTALSARRQLRCRSDQAE